MRKQTRRKLSLKDLKTEVMQNTVGDDPGNWLWWFWLFFIENKKTKEQEQLMILWSTKNDTSISCNDFVFTPNQHRKQNGKDVLDGGTAAWYFDGKEMHEDFILEKSEIFLDKGKLTAKAKNLTKCFLKNDTFFTEINSGKTKMRFKSKISKNPVFTPSLSKTSLLGGRFNYDVLQIGRLGLEGTIEKNGKSYKIVGSSYFQKVLVNSPVTPWYWGVYHFPDGSMLGYFDVHLSKFLAGKARKIVPILTEAHFYNAQTKTSHFFDNVVVRRKGKTFPKFEVVGKNKTEHISFTVSSRSEAAWRFTKKRGPFSTKLTYNEYPSEVKNLVLKTPGRTFTSQDVGIGIGNAEHTWGLLL